MLRLFLPQRASASSERTYVLAVSFTHALIHATELTYAALLFRIEEEFGSGLFLLGVLANVGAFAFGLGALPAGALVDRIGTVRVLRITLALSAAAAVVVGLSASELMLGLALAFLGLATGLYHPAGITLLARTARPARNLGLHGTIGNLGIAGAPAMAAAAAVLIDWRAAYFLLALLAALGWLAMLRLGTTGPRPPARGPVAAPPDPGVTAETPRSAALAPLFLVYGVFVMSGLIYRGSLTFLPAHIEEHVSFTFFGWEVAAVAGSLTALALLTGAVGWYVGGHVAERFAREKVALAATLLLAPALLLVSVAGEGALILAVMFFVFVNFLSQPAFVTLVAEYAPAGRLGTSYGLTFFLSFGVGSFAASIAGAVAALWGIDAVFQFLAIVAIAAAAISAVLVILARRRGRAPLPAPP